MMTMMTRIVIAVATTIEMTPGALEP